MGAEFLDCTLSTAHCPTTMAKRGYYEVLGVTRTGHRGRDHQGVPRPGQEVPPGPQPRRRRRSSTQYQEVTEAYEVLRDAAEAAGLRPPRARRAGRTAGRAEWAASASISRRSSATCSAASSAAAAVGRRRAAGRGAARTSRTFSTSICSKPRPASRRRSRFATKRTAAMQRQRGEAGHAADARAGGAGAGRRVSFRPAA